MQILNYWKQFEHTGRVEDYLSYTSAAGKTANSMPKQEGSNRDEAGANPYAGIHMCNRNDIETDAYRGI